MRLTTDAPKDNFEMALNLFYVKDEEVWVRGYGKGGTDISLINLTREILSHQCPYVEPDISDDDLIMMMPEWLFDDVRSTEHVVGLLYQAAWVCAELREHLKQFEDVFKTPENAEWAKETIEMAFSDDTSEVERLRELYKADKDGRVVVLPCKVGANMIDQISKDCPRLMKNVRPAIVYVRKGVIYNMALETFEGAVSEGLIFPASEEAEKALRKMQGKEDADGTHDKPE